MYRRVSVEFDIMQHVATYLTPQCLQDISYGILTKSKRKAALNGHLILLQENHKQSLNWMIIQSRITVVAYFPLLKYHCNISDWSTENILIGKRDSFYTIKAIIMTNTKKYINIHFTAGE